MLWICGCEERSKKIDNPHDYPRPPERILCPSCGDVTSTVYKKSYGRFWFCFIPCCCKTSASDPYLACINCGQHINPITMNACKNCGLTTTFKSNNCPSCGQPKDRL
jgi:membrane protease subunit (stomatin/prohibitin family)